MKTANELGIKQWEYDGLVALIDFLPTLEHKTHYYNYSGKLFDMNDQCSKSRCGTVACIGGWNYMLTHVDKRESRVVDYVNSYGIEHPKRLLTGLGQLYYPGMSVLNDTLYQWGEITPDIAVKAIQNYLTTGNPQWNTFGISAFTVD